MDHDADDGVGREGSNLARKRTALLVAPLLVPILVFVPALVAARLLAVGDGLHYDLPLYLLARQAWEARQIPTWNPHIFSGAPLLAIGQAGVFYPPNVLFLVSKFWTYNCLLLFHLAVAGAGAAALARRLSGDDLGAAIAGLGFALCGFFFGHVAQANLLASAAWLPWALLAFERVRERLSTWRIAQAGGTVALGFLAGFLQMGAITLAVLAVYAASLAVLEGRRARGRTVILAAAVAAVGCCLAAPQLVPTLAVLDQTARSSADISFVTADSLSWSHVPLLLFPYLFGNPHPHFPFTADYRGDIDMHALAGYPGMALLILAIVGVGVVRTDRRALALVPVGVLTVIAMLGDNTPAGHLIAALPVYGKFRAWARYVIVLDLVIAVFAAYGVATWRTADPDRRRTAARRGAIAAAVLVVAAIAIPRIPGAGRLVAPGMPGILALAVPGAAALLAAGCCFAVGRYQSVAAAALVVLVIVDPIASFGGFFQWRDSGTIATAVRLYSTPHPPALGSLKAPTGWDRYLVKGEFEGWSLLVNSLQGLSSVNGKEQLRPEAYSSALEVSPSGRIKPRSSLFNRRAHTADLLRVTTLVDYSKGQSEVVRPRIPKLADAFLVGRVEQRPRQDVLAAIDGRRRFDPRRVALVERCGQWCRPLRRPGPAGAVLRERHRGDSTVLQLASQRAGLLKISRAWFPGWEADVDGRPVPVVRADGLIIGVPVPAGRHAVVARYRAPGLTTGLAVSLAAAVVLLAAGVVSRTRRRPAT